MVLLHFNTSVLIYSFSGIDKKKIQPPFVLEPYTICLYVFNVIIFLQHRYKGLLQGRRIL